jgi:hypothetical protein
VQIRSARSLKAGRWEARAPCGIVVRPANQLAATAVDEGKPPTDSNLLMAFSALASHCSKATSGAEAFVTES